MVVVFVIVVVVVVEVLVVGFVVWADRPLSPRLRAVVVTLIAEVAYKINNRNSNNSRNHNKKQQLKKLKRFGQIALSWFYCPVDVVLPMVWH